jgi:manganese/iron transport system permease protein
MVLGVEIVHRQTALSEDTGIGLLFVGMLALGVVIISKSTTYTGSLTSILFGDALGVSRSDLVGQALLAAPVMLAALALYRPLLALSFDARKAKALGMRPTLAHTLLLVLIAAAVIGSFQAVGTLLVFGLLVGPPATAALLARTVAGMFVWSIVVAVASVFIGLVASFHLGTAGSATMALAPIVAFFAVLAVVTARARFRRRSSVGRDGADAAVGGSGPRAESAHA